jgi:energy-coupling factor transporter transmembrane protein EcfT
MNRFQAGCSTTFLYGNLAQKFDNYLALIAFFCAILYGSTFSVNQSVVVLLFSLCCLVFGFTYPSIPTQKQSSKYLIQFEKTSQNLIKVLPFILISVSVLLAFTLPSEACVGYLCGVKDKLNATEGFKDGKVLWEMIFVGLQAVIALIFGAISFFTAIKVRKEESWVEFFALGILFLLVLFFTNYAAGQLMGTSTASNAATTTTP